MRRHNIVQKVAVALIAGHLVLAAALVWGSRREAVTAIALADLSYPTDAGLGIRTIPAGSEVQVLAPKLPWHSRDLLPIVGEDGSLPTASLLAAPLPTTDVFVARAGVPLRKGSAPSDPQIATLQVGEVITIASFSSVLLSGRLLSDVWAGLIPVVSGTRVIGFVAEQDIQLSAPSNTDRLTGVRVALEEGRFEDARRRAALLAHDAFGRALQFALREGRAHRSAPVLHGEPETIAAVPTTLAPYDPDRVIEELVHLHDGQPSPRQVERLRNPEEPFPRAFVGLPDTLLWDGPLGGGTVIAVLPFASEVSVRHAERDWLHVQALVAPPVRLEGDLTAALTRGGELFIERTPSPDRTAVEGWVRKDALTFAISPVSAMREGAEQLLARSPAEGLALASALDPIDPPTAEHLRQRTRTAWTEVQPTRVVEDALALWGEGTLRGSLLAAEVVSGCANVGGCEPSCGERWVPAGPLARTRPTTSDRANTRHLYLRLRGRPAVTELPLSIVAHLSEGDACGPAVDPPRIASFVYRPLTDADHELWMRLPDVPLRALSVVVAPASKAVAMVSGSSRPYAAIERPAVASKARTLFLASRCSDGAVAAGTVR